MTKIGVLTDSGSDILQFPQLEASLDVRVVYLYINIGDEKFTDETMTIDELLERMKTAEKHNWPKTSQPSVGDFAEQYEKFKADGYTDVISIHVASNLSGTVNSARLASESVEGINVHIVDSQMASSGEIPCLLKAKILIDSGMEPQKIAKTLNAYSLEHELFIAVPQLDNLYKGGRLKPIRYRLGKFLKFRPILRINHGELLSFDKTRSLEASQAKSYDYAVKPFSQDDDFGLLISHAWTEETAKVYAEKFKQDFPDHDVNIGRVGPTMAVHLGPGGLVFTAYKK